MSVKTNCAKNLPNLAKAPQGQDIQGKDLQFLRGWEELRGTRYYQAGAHVVQNSYAPGSALLENAEAPSFTCAEIEQRLQSLNNWEDITSGKGDPLFPAQMSSITSGKGDPLFPAQ